MLGTAWMLRHFETTSKVQAAQAGCRVALVLVPIAAVVVSLGQPLYEAVRAGADQP
jgi:hypothetical protein